MTYNRLQNFTDLGKESAFLWGARQTGKSTLLKMLYPYSMYVDLLLGNEYERYLRNPSLLREVIEAKKPEGPIIIDEIQLLPSLLNEIQWLIVNRKYQFILSGSSPRNIIRRGNNLLGGRAFRYELFPLVSAEIEDFDLEKALNTGLLPRHYTAVNADRMISSYIGNYLRDEIIREARIRNITAFSRFLEAAAFSNGEIVNYTNIASDCGVSVTTIREYFQILEDTLTGRFLPAFQKRPKRRIILSPKFYYFDIGLTNYLLKRGNIRKGSESFGHAFEHLIYHEIYSYSHYSGFDYPLSFWRTTTGNEVDFILGDHEVAIEVKASEMAHTKHLKGLKTFTGEYTVKKSILISNDPEPRKTGEINIMPWRHFLKKLWGGEIIQ
jgi:uncharacterized protein